MRLKKRQKEALLAWITEGLETDEINARGTVFVPPFQVSRSQVQGYRERRQIEVSAIRAVGEFDALTAGLAVRAERVKRLQTLATLMEQDLFGGFLWTEDVKSVGSGPYAKIVDFEKFNAAEVSEYRGVLDDIAKEMGERRQGVTALNITPDELSKMNDSELDALARKRGLL